MKAMMTLIVEEDDKYSSCQKDRNRKQQLVQMMGELNRSYSCLVHKYDELSLRRSKSLNVPRFGSSSNSRQIQHQQASNKVVEVEVSGDPIILNEHHHHRSSFEYMNKLADDLILTEQCNMFIMTDEDDQTNYNREFSDIVLKINHGFQPQIYNKPTKDKYAGGERENALFQLKFHFTKLMEENLRQQAQLLRRNEEKRVTINGLRLQLERLKAQQQKCLHCSNFGLKRNPSKSTSLFLGKFFHGRC